MQIYFLIILISFIKGQPIPFYAFISALPFYFD